MSINICPYDCNLCQKMELRFDAWQKVVSQSNGFIQIHPDALDECPVVNENEREAACDRYRMVAQKVKTNLINERQ